MCREPAASRPKFLRRNVVQKLFSVVHVVCSLAHGWHGTIVLTTMSLSYAVQKSAAASSLKANRSSRHMSRNCISTSRPRSRSDAAPRFISATPSAYFAAPRAKSSLDSSAICSASPIARSAVVDEQDAVRYSYPLPPAHGCGVSYRVRCVGPNSRSRPSPLAIPDCPATTAQRPETPVPLPRVIR